MPQNQASLLDTFIQALISGDAVTAGTILETNAQSAGIPPQMVQLAAQHVGLSDSGGNWAFQSDTGIPTLGSAAAPAAPTPMSFPPSTSTPELMSQVQPPELDLANQQSITQELADLVTKAKASGVELDPTELAAIQNAVNRKAQSQLLLAPGSPQIQAVGSIGGIQNG